MKIARVLCALFGALTMSSVCAAEAITTEAFMQWKRLGINPYATSTEAACKMAPEAITGFKKMPDPVKKAFIEMLGTTCAGNGKLTYYITPGTKFVEMWEGGTPPKVNENVQLARIPVLKDEFGRKLVASTVFETPEALWWSLDFEGNRYYMGMPLICGNFFWILKEIPKPLPASAPASAPATVRALAPQAGPCPQGYTLTAHAWELSKLPDNLRRQAEALIAAATRRESSQARDQEAYKPDDFSRTLNGRLRREVKVHAPDNVNIPVRLLDPTTLAVVEVVGPLNLVNGVGSITLTDQQRHLIIETIWPANYASPTLSGGERRNRLFFHEWVDWCGMNVGGARP